MRAALPYVDRFVAGHDLASLEELAGLLSGIERRHVGMRAVARTTVADSPRNAWYVRAQWVGGFRFTEREGPR